MPEKIRAILDKYKGDQGSDSDRVRSILSKYQTNEPSLGEKTQAGLEGFGQGVSSGYLPQLQSLAEPAMTKALDLVTGQEVYKDLPSYTARRDENIKRQEAQAERMPGQYYGGLIGGGIASAPAYGKALGLIPGLKMAPTSTLQGLKQATLGGAIQGAISNPGDTEGDINLLQPKERLENTVSGAAFGAIPHLLGTGIKSSSDFILGLPERLRDWSQLKAAKSAGMMLKDYRAASARSPSFNPDQRVKELGQSMIDHGLVAPGSTFEDIAEKSLDLKTKAGQIIGDIYKTASDQIKGLSRQQRVLLSKTDLNAKKWAKELSTKLEKKLSSKAGGKTALSSIQNNLEELAENGNNANLLKIQEFKSDLDDLIKYNKKLDDTPLANQTRKEIRDFISEKIQDRIKSLDKVFGSEKLQTLKEANKDYGIWSEIHGVSQDRVRRESANRMFSLTDTIAGSAGVGTGGVVGGLLTGDLEGAAEGAIIGSGLGLINKAGRLYGNPLLATGANKASKAIKSIPGGKLGQSIGGLLKDHPKLVAPTAARVLSGKKKGFLE